MLTADFRYAVRTLIAGRLFTAIAVICLALAIATNTTHSITLPDVLPNGGDSAFFRVRLVNR